MYEFTNEEIREIFKRYKLYNLKVIQVVFLFVFLILGLQLLFIGGLVENTPDEAIIIMVIAAISMVIPTFVVMPAIKKYQHNEKPIKELNWYLEYETDGYKMPISKVVQQGKSSTQIPVLGIIDTSYITTVMLTRKRNIDQKFPTSEVTFLFYQKTKNDEIKIKHKLVLLYRNKKYTYFMLKGAEEKIFKHIRSEGYKYTLYEKRNVISDNKTNQWL